MLNVWSLQQHTHDKRQRHILLPTPTVRGHAEACPSTTYAKYLKTDAHSFARWPRPWFLAYLVESFVVAGRGGTRLPACVVWGPHTQKVVFFSEISKSARQNCLKFGMRLPIGEKIRSVGGDLFG